MDCIFCYGRVKKIDEYGNVVVVECQSCSASYEVPKEEYEKKNA